MHRFALLVISLVQTDSVHIHTPFFKQCDVNLEKTLYDVTFASSLLDCAVACSSNSNCLYFGFETADGTCHQHEQKGSAGTSEMKKKNWVQSKVSFWSKTSGFRSDGSCKKGDDRVTTASVLVEAKVTLPPGHCPLPVDIPNANISWGKQQEGSARTYTCNDGYMDTSLDSMRAVTTCMADGEWSKVQLNCSGPYVQMKTPYLPSYSFRRIPSETLQVITGKKTSVIFLVKTCNDANFGLNTKGNIFSKFRAAFTKSFTKPDIEIVIGGWNNTRSVIRTCFNCGDDLRTEHYEEGILSCSEFKPLWLSWGHGRISIGVGGVVGEGKFMEWKPPRDFRIHSVGLSSYINNTGRWLFLREN